MCTRARPPTRRAPGTGPRGPAARCSSTAFLCPAGGPARPDPAARPPRPPARGPPDTEAHLHTANVSAIASGLIEGQDQVGLREPSSTAAGAVQQGHCRPRDRCRRTRSTPSAMARPGRAARGRGRRSWSRIRSRGSGDVGRGRRSRRNADPFHPQVEQEGAPRRTDSADIEHAPLPRGVPGRALSRGPTMSADDVGQTEAAIPTTSSSSTVRSTGPGRGPCPRGVQARASTIGPSQAKT